MSLFVYCTLLAAAPVLPRAGAQAYYGYGYYSPYYGNAYDKGAFAVDEFFDTLQGVWDTLEQSHALEAHIQDRRNRLENYKSVQRYYQEGIPPFAATGPDGRPRPPSIRWEDVESIR